MSTISTNPTLRFAMPGGGGVNLNAAFEQMIEYNVILTDGCEKATGSGKYYPGSKVTLDATNVPFFLKWNDVNGNAIDPIYSNDGKTIVFTMPEDEVIFWIEQEENYEVIVGSNAPDETSGSGFYRPGDTVTIHSGPPSSGEMFESWGAEPEIPLSSYYDTTATFSMIDQSVTLWVNWLYN